MKYYLKALGSVCYDREGITFPLHYAVQFDNMARAFFGNKFAWQTQFGWTNQPEVLTFTCSKNVAELFDTVVNIIAQPKSAGLPILKVMPRDW